MRLRERSLSGGLLLNAATTLELLESYPDDKYLPSYLVRGQSDEIVFHALIAADVEGDNVRIVTMYVPRTEEWDPGYRLRKELL